MWCFGCGRGGIFFYHAHIGRSWCSCLPALVSASPSTQEVYSMKLGFPAPPGCSLHISPSPGCPGCPSTHHCAALPVARGQMRELSTPNSVWETALDMQTSPKAQGPELPISEAGPRVFATLSLCTKSSISTKPRIPHHTFPFLLQWEVFLPGMGGVWRRPRSAAVALLSSADAGRC